MVVGVCRLTLLAPHCHSLKEKRSVVRRVKDQVRSRFRVPLAEVGGQDTWQRIVLGFAVVGIDRAHVEGAVDKIARYVEDVAACKLYDDEREVITFGDQAFAPDPDDEAERAGDWIPKGWLEGEES